jgi:triphosphoribosyl-dephospho-CoA synthase
MAAGKLIRDQKELTPVNLTKEAFNIVKETDVRDAIKIYMSFEHAGVKVRKVDKYDMSNADAIEEIKKNSITLFQLMEMSSSYDIIAREWISCFRQCAECARLITSEMKENGILTHSGNSRINHVIVYAFLKMLAYEKDTFIETKFNSQIAEEVSEKAKQIILKLQESGHKMESILDDVHNFDEDLLARNINPGSTADIIIGGLFIALLGGMRF